MDTAEALRAVRRKRDKQMIRPTLSEVFRMLDIRWWQLLITFLCYGLHNYIVYLLSTAMTRHYMLNHEMPYLHDETLKKITAERDKLRTENKELRKENHGLFAMVEGAKSKLGVEVTE